MCWFGRIRLSWFWVDSSRIAFGTSEIFSLQGRSRAEGFDASSEVAVIFISLRGVGILIFNLGEELELGKG